MRAGAVALSRLELLAATLGHGHGSDGPVTGRRELADLIAASVDLGDPDEVWCALSILQGTVATHEDVVAVVRAARRAGGGALVDALARPGPRDRTVRTAVGEVLVDVTQTAQTDLVTGIQRVALETVRQWSAHHEVLPVVWTADGASLRTLTAHEGQRLGWRPAGDRWTLPETVVPWRSTVLVPELADDARRISGFEAIARHARGRTGVIGFDCVPYTSPETVRDGFHPLFFRHLAATGHVTAVAAISRAAAQEYDGWREALALIGSAGPRICTVPLPEVAHAVAVQDVEELREHLGPGTLPLVLVVGSHEPRKNHLAVLHAAELCWRSGDRFVLAMVGGSSWATDDFDREVGQLLERGRPLRIVSRLPDRLLWAAYRMARFTVFPSLNEGFGLPVAESLAAGTPAITSDFGSMREIAAAGGCVLLDPRDPGAIAAAVHRLLHDDVAVARLRAEAARRPARTWADYAEELWSELVTGSGSARGPSTRGSTR